MSEKIVVITYDFPHRKTQEVVFRLKAKDYHNVLLLALPFVKRENPFKPIYQHRPSNALDIYPEFLADSFGYQFQKVTVKEIEEILEAVRPIATLIAGAGILPASLVQNHQIINSHPAYLPEVRGLDALKWAIHEKQKIGVTSHFVVENADAGFMIDRKEVPVYQNDTFHSLAYRQFETEMDMLVEAIELIEQKADFPTLEEKGEVHRRMPKRIEEHLLSDFEEYKKVYAN